MTTKNCNLKYFLCINGPTDRDDIFKQKKKVCNFTIGDIQEVQSTVVMKRNSPVAVVSLPYSYQNVQSDAELIRSTTQTNHYKRYNETES